MNYDLYLVGVGGQGVLTIAELITEAAYRQGIPVNYYPTEGMAQRGGFVKAQVRLGRERVGPSIPERGADLVMALEVSESLKAVRFAKPGADFVLWGHVWAPTAVMLGKAGYPALEAVQEQIRAAGCVLHPLDESRLPLYTDGLPVADNMFVLGFVLAATRLREVITPESVLAAITARWPKAAGRNAFAFQAGMEESRLRPRPHASAGDNLTE